MKPRTNTGFQWSIVFIALVYCFNAMAKTSDENAPLQIEADRLEIHEKDNYSIYNGNVIITKGSLKITGDKIVIKNKQARLHSVNIDGNPATFFQLNDLNEAINAESREMNYQAQSGMLELINNAKLIKNKNHFSSEHIIYNTFEDIVKAGNQKAGNQNSGEAAKPPRVKITIYPENKPTTDSGEN